MTYWVYKIQSASTGRYYCGYSDDVERRVTQHNDPEYRGGRTTKVFPGPGNIVWTQECANRSEAVVLEKKIKKRDFLVSRVFPFDDNGLCDLVIHALIGSCQ